MTPPIGSQRALAPPSQSLASRTADNRGAIAALLVGTLDQLPHAVVVLGPRGQVLHANVAARALLTEDAPLTLRGRRLRAGSATGDGLLHRAVQRVRSGSRRAAASARAVGLTFASVSGAQRLQVVASALPDAAHKRAIGVVLFITDPRHPPRIDASAIAALFHLSRAEARLAVQLADGQTLSNAAGALGIARNTARNQLRAVLAKTDTARQADLVRVLLGSVATFHNDRQWSIRTMEIVGTNQVGDLQRSRKAQGQRGVRSRD